MQVSLFRGVIEYIFLQTFAGNRKACILDMKIEKKYIEYILKQAEAPSLAMTASSFTEKVTDYLC